MVLCTGDRKRTYVSLNKNITQVVSSVDIINAEQIYTKKIYNCQLDYSHLHRFITAKKKIKTQWIFKFNYLE